MTRNYWWPGVIKDVEKYVDRYNLYQKTKKQNRATSREINSE